MTSSYSVRYCQRGELLVYLIGCSVIGNPTYGQANFLAWASQVAVRLKFES